MAKKLFSFIAVVAIVGLFMSVGVDIAGVSLAAAAVAIPDLARHEVPTYLNLIADSGDPQPKYDPKKLKKFYGNGQGNTGDNTGIYECTAFFGDFFIKGKSMSRGEKFRIPAVEVKSLAVEGLIAEVVPDSLVEAVEGDLDTVVKQRAETAKTEASLNRAPITADVLAEAIVAAGGKVGKK